MEKLVERVEFLTAAFFQEDASLRGESLEVATMELEELWSYYAFRSDFDALAFLNSRLLHAIGRCNVMVGETADDLQCRYLIIWETICNLTQALVQRAPGREALAELRQEFSGMGEEALIQLSCWETIDEVATVLSISEQNCRDALNQLKRKGFLSSVPDGHGHGYVLTGKGFAAVTELRRVRRIA